MALSELRHRDALLESRKASALGDAQDKDFSTQVTYTRGLAVLGSGTLSAGQVECQKAFDVATRAGVPRLIASAQLAEAEVMLASGDARGASSASLQAQETLARLGRRHSEWCAWLVAAQASRRLQDEAKVHEYASRAAELLTALERAWGRTTTAAISPGPMSGASAGSSTNSCREQTTKPQPRKEKRP
jgi:hypothetical protein